MIAEPCNVEHINCELCSALPLQLYGVYVCVWLLIMKTLWDDDDDIGEAPLPLSLLPLQLVIHSTQSIIICRRPSSIEKAADTEGTKWCKGGGKEGHWVITVKSCRESALVFQKVPLLYFAFVAHLCVRPQLSSE